MGAYHKNQYVAEMDVQMGIEHPAAIRLKHEDNF